MRFKVFLEKRAVKQLEKMESKSREKLKEKIRKLQLGFSPELDIKKLKGYKNHYRLRIGDHRVLFTIEEGSVIVYDILRREKAY